VSSPARTFACEGKEHTCSTKARFLVESANGTSSYTLDRGFGDPVEAVRFYGELPAGGNKKKRLTMIDEKKRTVLARTK
jgi:hypothetical protein